MGPKIAADYEDDPNEMSVVHNMTLRCYADVVINREEY